jgi:hypothetical protein
MSAPIQRNISNLPGVDYTAATHHDNSSHDVSPDEASSDIQDLLHSSAYQHAGDIHGINTLRAAIQALGRQPVNPGDMTAVDTGLRDSDAIAAQLAAGSAHTGPVAAAQRLLMQNQLGQVAQGGNLAQLAQAQNQATGGAGQVGQQEANANGQDAMALTGQSAAQRLKQYVMEGLAHHATLQQHITSQGFNNVLNNAQTDARETLASSGQMATLGADAQGIKNDANSFNSNMQLARGALGAVGAGLGMAARASSTDPYANADANFANASRNTPDYTNEVYDVSPNMATAGAADAFGQPASSVYSSPSAAAWEPTEALA